jgi:uncharacterized protein
MDHSGFVVFLHKIPPEGLDLSWEIADPGRAGVAVAVPVDGPIGADFRVERFGNEIRVTGEVRASLRLECSRCLALFDLPVRGEVDATFAPRSAAAPDDQHELAPDDLEVQPLEQGAADLRGVIAEQIHLAIPLKPLCSEGCRGICPRCGADQALGACGCATGVADPRWEALRKLAVKG